MSSFIPSARRPSRGVTENANARSLVSDQFRDERSPGRVLGTRASSGVRRLGRDAERRLAVDHGALRMQPLLVNGWGREAIAYGPLSRKPGLALAVGVLNGHNSSETGGLDQSLAKRVRQWMSGPGTPRMRVRFRKLLRSGRLGSSLRQLASWVVTSVREPVSLDGNLSVGWFDAPFAKHPDGEGNGFVVRPRGEHNGELRARVRGGSIVALEELQNVPIVLVVVLRAQGAAYYVASPFLTPGRPHTMRPVAIDPSGRDTEVYAGVQQSVLGQIGFRVDTRVYGVEVAQLDVHPWAGLANVAFRLTGQGVVRAGGGGDSTKLDSTGKGPEEALRVARGAFRLTERGAEAVEPDSLALVRASEAAGLVHVLIEGGEGPGAVSLVFRARDAENHFGVSLSQEGAALCITCGGRSDVLAQSSSACVRTGEQHSLQVRDDGARFSVFLDGESLFESTDPRFGDAPGVGICAEPCRHRLRFLEAHPRGVAVPEELRVAVPNVQRGSRTVLREEFAGPACALHGRPVERGAGRWRRALGVGEIEIADGGGARVRGSKTHPNPGRTLYLLDWNRSDYAELVLEATPPGWRRGQSEDGRTGVVFWQDEENYLVVSTWLHDGYGGASVSSFYCMDGFEDVFSAVWTNVGERITWGRRHELGVAFDGRKFVARLDGEAVLFRALSDVWPRWTDLRIHAVGIAVNWEWGNDTGSRLHCFEAREE